MKDEFDSDGPAEVEVSQAFIADLIGVSQRSVREYDLPKNEYKRQIITFDGSRVVAAYPLKECLRWLIANPKGPLLTELASAQNDNDEIELVKFTGDNIDEYAEFLHLLAGQDLKDEKIRNETIQKAAESQISLLQLALEKERLLTANTAQQIASSALNIILNRIRAASTDISRLITVDHSQAEAMAMYEQIIAEAAEDARAQIENDMVEEYEG